MIYTIFDTPSIIYFQRMQSIGDLLLKVLVKMTTSFTIISIDQGKVNFGMRASMQSNVGHPILSTRVPWNAPRFFDQKARIRWENGAFQGIPYQWPTMKISWSNGAILRAVNVPGNRTQSWTPCHTTQCSEFNLKTWFDQIRNRFSVGKMSPGWKVFLK